MTFSIYKCKTCGDPFKGRIADRKRGWAKFCSKSCKAIKQTHKTGVSHQGRIYLPNDGWIKNGYEYDKHGNMVGFQMSIADMNACQD